MRRKSNFKERICALLLALLMPLTSVLPHVTLVANAEGDTGAKSVTFIVTDLNSNPLQDAKVEIYPVASAEAILTDKTNHEGKVVFDLEDADSCQYKVSKEEYRNIAGDILGDEVTVALEPMDEIQITPPDQAKIEEGTTLQLSVGNPVPDVDYTWSSSDTSVASADAQLGLITGNSRGTADISVSGNGKTQTKKITVVKTPEMTLTVTPNKGPVDASQDVESVTLEARLPEDAGGTVTFYKGSVDQANVIGTAQNVDSSGIVSFTVSEGSGTELIGNQTFWAVYSGSDKNYYLGTQISTQGNYLKNYQLQLKQSSGTAVYGDTSAEVPEVDPDTVKDRGGLSYESSNEEVVTVDNQGKLEIKGASEDPIVISVSVEANDLYTASTANYTLQVSKLDLGTVKLSDFVWQSAEKVYDENTEMPALAGKLTKKENSMIVGNDEIVISAKADVILGAGETKAAVGTYNKCRIQDVLTKDVDNYKFTLDESQKDVSLEGGNQIRINKRPVYIKADQKSGEYVEVPYGSSVKDIENAVEEAVKEDRISLKLAGKKGQITTGTEQGLVGEDTITLTDYAEIILNGNSFYVGNYDSAIQPNVTNKDAGNYEVMTDEKNIGNYSAGLKITQEVVKDDELWARLKLDASQSKNVSENNGQIWIGATGEAVFSMKETTYYDKIHIKNSDTEYPNNRLKINKDSVGENSITDAENEIYLSWDGQADTRTTSSADKENQNNRIPKGLVKIDNQIPEVKFVNLGTAGLSSVLQGETVFTRFTNGAYVEKIQVTDGSGSGVKEYSYSLLEINSGDNVIDMVQNAATSSGTVWTGLTGTEINVPDSPHGYYIVLVKAVDMVNNTAVYASNGLVVEVGKPEIQLNITSIASVDGVYNNDVNYEIQVTDPEAVQSGIESIEVVVEAGGNRVEGDKAAYTNSYILKNSDLNELKELDIKNGGYTFQNLAEKSIYKISGKLIAQDCNSNQIEVKVTARDQAGNCVETEISELMIDTIKPEITVSYDNNEPKETSYFSDNRTMTIVYKERNFLEKLAVFEVSVDGGETFETKTLSELSSVDGISATLLSDTEEKTESGKRSDARLITYAIEFNGGTSEDTDYVIKPSVSDMGGNKNAEVIYAPGTAAEEAFTVDKKAPVIDISYGNNDVRNDHYFKDNRKMTITYTERNFMEKALSFEVYKNQDAVSLEELKGMEGISVKAIEIKDGMDEDKHTYEISFGEKEKDIDFKIIPHIADKAGNINSGANYEKGTAAPEEFTVDRVTPELSVQYYTLDKQGNKIEDIAEGDIGTVKQDSMYKNQYVAAEVTIKERNFAAGEVFTGDEMRVNETAVDVEGSADGITAEDHTGSAQTVGNWISDPMTQDIRMQTFFFKVDANYTFNITFMDEAGNSSSLVKGGDGDGDQVCHYFTVDTAAPDGDIVEEQQSVTKRFLESITFGFFSNQKVIFSTAAEDETSPVKISYYKHYPGRDARGSFDPLGPDEIKAVSDWTELSGTEADRYIISKKMSAYYDYTVEKTEQAVPYEKIEDKAGNITYLYTDGVICEDKEAAIGIDITTDAGSPSFEVKEEEVVYNTDVSFEISVKDTAEKDAKGNDVYSGLQLIEYGVYVNGQLGPVQGTISFEPEQRQESYCINEVIPSASYNSNDVIIKVRAIDNAGNLQCMSKALKIDITEPQIAVKYDNNNAANDTYFKDNRTMQIIYKERNINREGITFDFKAGGNTYSNITLKELEKTADQSGIQILRVEDSQEDWAAEQFSDDRTLICEIEFTGSEAKDMDYSLTPHIEDQASNIDRGAVYEEGTKAPVEFTVDKVKPTLNIEYYLVNGKELEKLSISTDEINRLYKNRTIRAIATVRERNFSLADSFSGEFKQVVPYFTWKTDDGSQGSTEDFENAAKARGMWKPAGSAGSNEWMQTFDFIADGDYSFRMEYTDLAGNTLEKAYAKHYFTVDKTAPKIDVTYEAEGEPVKAGDVEKNRLYRNKKITATVKITERNFQRGDRAENFEKAQMNLSYKALDVNPEEIDAIENYTESADTRGKWTSEGYVRTQVFTFVNDANYQLALTYKDLAGNQIDYGTHYFTVDKTSPTGEIKIRESVWTDLVNFVFFNIFTGSTENVDLTSSDITAGVASTQYYKYIPETESRNTFEVLTWDQLEKITDWTDGYHTSVNANEQVIVYEKIVDRAGNVSYINAHEGVIADSEKPQAPEIRITIAEPSQGIYNGDVPFTIDVKDPEAGGTYSGLEYVEYQILCDGKESQSGNYNSELSIAGARVQSIHKSETVYSNRNNSNHVTIKVKAVDWSGNFSEAEKDIKIDITDPEVEITYDLNNPSNGKYYNATRTATVTVKERNFDPDAVDFTITNTDGTMPSVSGWSISPVTGETDEAFNTCTVTFAADGDYTINMNCTDRAGNRSNYTQVDEFTIDQTVPTISVAYDNNSAANGTYYDKPRTATITVNEHNFNGSEVQAAISASLQSQGISAPGVNGWSTSGDSHTASISFSGDGDYSFTINYTDLAGNPATAYTQDKFTVDQTKPEIEIFDIKDKSANNGVVAPGVKYSDVNYDASAVKISIKGPKHSERTVSGTRSSIPNGESIKMADFERKESVDDVYTLTAQVTDMAGNVDEKSVMFSVNRFGSNFIFGKSTEAFLDQYYSNEEQDLIVTEINVDTLVHNGISYGLDGELVNLEKGTDYTVKESGNEASWKSYQYTMKASNFEREGLYNITIDSKDRANNEVNNKVKESEIEFVIDKTQPTVVITGVENDGQYRTNSRDIAITVADNVAMDSLDVNVDGKEGSSTSYDAKEILKQNGEIPFSLADSSNWQEIKAVATDAAGNTAETSEIRVLITANLLVQFYRNTPLVVGSSVGLAALAAVLIILISRKKKVNRKEAE